MRLKTYRANSIAEALVQVKKDLGRDAVILHTRTVRTGGFLGLWSKSVVEITASDQVNVPGRGRRDGGASAQAPSKASRNASVDAYLKNTSGSRPEPVMMESVKASAERPVMEPGVGADESAALGASDGVVLQVRNRRPGALAIPAALHSQDGEASVAIHRELADIKLLVNQVLQASPCGQAAGLMPEALFQHYVRLLEARVSREMTDRIIGAVRDELSAGELQDAAIVRETVLRHLAGLFPITDGVASPGKTPDGRPLTIALIGPTGVGKTTTTAKLAAAYKLRHGRSVALITCDTYRIAAVDQLRTYAGIIGLPLKVVLSPAEMTAAVQAVSGHDVVLIDTAGRSPNAADRLSELSEFLSAASPHETHLVLSTASCEESMMRTAQAFASARPNRVLFTKLDEAVNFGVLANVVQRLGDAGSRPGGGLPLSFLTTGQEVPDHIEPGKPERLARMILDNRLEGAALAGRNAEPAVGVAS